MRTFLWAYWHMNCRSTALYQAPERTTSGANCNDKNDVCGPSITHLFSDGHRVGYGQFRNASLVVFLRSGYDAVLQGGADVWSYSFKVLNARVPPGSAGVGVRVDIHGSAAIMTQGLGAQDLASSTKVKPCCRLVWHPWGVNSTDGMFKPALAAGTLIGSQGVSASLQQSSPLPGTINRLTFRFTWSSLLPQGSTIYVQGFNNAQSAGAAGAVALVSPPGLTAESSRTDSLLQQAVACPCLRRTRAPCWVLSEH